MNLNDAEIGKEYIIADVITDGDEEMEVFCSLWVVTAERR